MSSTLTRASAPLLALLAALLLATAPAARADIVPIADCLTPSGTDGVLWVYYGYVNTGASVTVPFGDDNQVVPGIGFQGQPTVFNSGSYPRVFRAVFNTTAFTGISWILNGVNALATVAGTPRCLAGATGPAGDVAPDTATIHGLVTPEGTDTAYEFDYGTTIAYGSTTPERHSASTTGQPVQETLTGLTPGTTYHYRLVASGAITTVGDDRTFTTPAAPDPPVDLALSGRLSDASVTTGAPLALQLTATNPAGVAARGVKVLVALPAGAAFDAARSSAGCVAEADPAGVTCVIGDLAAGATAPLTVAFTPGRPGPATATAVVLGAQPDPDPADNQVSATAVVVAPPLALAPATPTDPRPTAAPATVTPVAGANLRLARHAPKGALRAGAPATVRLVAANRGPAAATGVVLVERLPAGVRVISAQVGRRRCTGTTTVRCRIGAVASGAGVTVTLRIRAAHAGRYTDTASIAGAQPDPAAADNVASGTLRVRAT